MPAEALDCRAVSTHRVNAKSRVCVRTNRYPVPVRLVGKRVTVRLGACSVGIIHDGQIVAPVDFETHAVAPPAAVAEAAE
ncbi:MAG: hypothetical protein GKR94_23915 [Gammaproteobacteria bacterium]|nr:hypothetical protein [Gammaproteobacteria bacterium]